MAHIEQQADRLVAVKNRLVHAPSVADEQAQRKTSARDRHKLGLLSRARRVSSRLAPLGF